MDENKTFSNNFSWHNQDDIGFLCHDTAEWQPFFVSNNCENQNHLRNWETQNVSTAGRCIEKEPSHFSAEESQLLTTRTHSVGYSKEAETSRKMAFLSAIRYARY